MQFTSYVIQLTDHQGVVQEIFVDIKTGVEAKNYEGVS